MKQDIRQKHSAPEFIIGLSALKAHTQKHIDIRDQTDGKEGTRSGHTENYVTFIYLKSIKGSRMAIVLWYFTYINGMRDDLRSY